MHRDFEALGLALKREGVDEFPPRVMPHYLSHPVRMNQLDTVEVWRVDAELTDLAFVKADEDDVTVEGVVCSAFQAYFHLPDFVVGESIVFHKVGSEASMVIPTKDVLSMICYAVAKARGKTNHIAVFNECMRSYLIPEEKVETDGSSAVAEVHTIEELRARVRERNNSSNT